jgi:hypothetical protein
MEVAPVAGWFEILSRHDSLGTLLHVYSYGSCEVDRVGRRDQMGLWEAESFPSSHFFLATDHGDNTRILVDGTDEYRRHAVAMREVLLLFCMLSTGPV